MYTVYTMKDFDTIAKKAVDKLFSTVGSLHYKRDYWDVLNYDFTINIPVDLPAIDEHYPILNITIALRHVTQREPDQTITFAEYL